ncbi:hypothetical protein ACH4PU_30675 [Streptomyces sp. NPDC021100]|uniref:hypothetical protein n=1 Tax=Streptomyces sp. NPDC021100 TaxID=3365114 RepID=UPI0037BC04E2
MTEKNVLELCRTAAGPGPGGNKQALAAAPEGALVHLTGLITESQPKRDGRRLLLSDPSGTITIRVPRDARVRDDQNPYFPTIHSLTLGRAMAMLGRKERDHVVAAGVHLLSDTA